MTLTGRLQRPDPAHALSRQKLDFAMQSLRFCSGALGMKEALPGRGEAKWQGFRSSFRQGPLWSQQLGSAESRFTPPRLAAGERTWFKDFKDSSARGRGGDASAYLMPD